MKGIHVHSCPANKCCHLLAQIVYARPIHIRQAAQVTINLTVPQSIVNSMTLIDVATNQPAPGYDPIPQNANINLLDFPSGINIRANTSGQVGTVKFYVNNAFFSQEGSAPFALAGDQSSTGQYLPWNVSPGTHTVRAVPFSGIHGGGMGGYWHEVTFTLNIPRAEPEIIIPQWLSNFTLIDVATNQPVPGFDPIPEGATINLSNYPAGINIRANALDGSIGSVVYFINGTQTRNENIAPYAIAGDEPQDQYLAWDAQPGSYTIRAVPHLGSDGTGMQGTPIELNITLQSN